MTDMEKRLAEALRQYFREYDTPVPDYGLRHRLRENLRAILAEYDAQGETE